MGIIYKGIVIVLLSWGIVTATAYVIKPEPERKVLSEIVKNDKVFKIIASY